MADSSSTHQAGGSGDQPKKSIFPGYGRFKIALSTILTIKVILELAVTFGYPNALIDEIQGAGDSAILMVMVMEGRGQIHPTDISPLLSALEDTGHLGVATDVRTWSLEYLDLNTGERLMTNESLKLSGFGRFKIAVSKVLRKQTSLDLGSLFGYPKALIDEIRNAKDSALLMIMHMEERGQIHPTDISPLLTALRELGLQGVATDVEDRFKEHLRITGKMEAFIRELKETGRTLYDKIQPIPYIKDKLYSVDKVFIEVGIEHRVEQDNWKTLSSYYGIFSVAKGSSRIQIIEGDPGYGKSTLALQLVYDWCNEVSDSPFSRPDILICLNLRQLGGMESIAKAIKQFALPRDSSLKRHDVEQLINNRNINILVIFDAYDEYPDQHSVDNFVKEILEEKSLRHVDILLTTRSSCIPHAISSQTGRIRLTGFDEAAREKYVRKAVTGDDEEAVQKILEQFNMNPILGDICQAPLFSAMYAHLAHEENMPHEIRSVTEFFGHMITCFHNHAQNKLSESGKSIEHLQTHANIHAALDKIAFEALTGKMQQLVWDQTLFLRELGEDFYKLYVDVGILVEDEVYDIALGKVAQLKKVVRFYHKLFCEWYAAYHLIKCVKSFRSWFYNFTKNIDPYDLQFVFRFACGLDQAGGSKVVKLVRKKKDGARFAVLCALELKEGSHDIPTTVRGIVSSDIDINKSDSRLLQRSTIQLLELASQHKIPISRVLLNQSFSSVDPDSLSLVLHSGLCLPPLSTLQELVIGTELGREVTVDAWTGILNYAKRCQLLKKLMFYWCLLPWMDSFPTSLDNVEVWWVTAIDGHEYTLQSGRWQNRSGEILTRGAYDDLVTRFREFHSYEENEE